MMKTEIKFVKGFLVDKKMIQLKGKNWFQITNYMSSLSTPDELKELRFIFMHFKKWIFRKINLFDFFLYDK